MQRQRCLVAQHGRRTPAPAVRAEGDPVGRADRQNLVVRTPHLQASRSGCAARIDGDGHAEEQREDKTDSEQRGDSRAPRLFLRLAEFGQRCVDDTVQTLREPLRHLFDGAVHERRQRIVSHRLGDALLH